MRCTSSRTAGRGSCSSAIAVIDAQALRDAGDLLAASRSALANDADLLLYGCDVAAGETGRAFVEQLAQSTGADVAASTDKTGSAAIGGNWTLEFATGTVRTQLTPGSFERLQWEGVLATFTVTSTADTNTAGTLRWAINQANGNGVGLDTIDFAIPVTDANHYYYTNNSVAGTVSLANRTATTAATDAALVNADPDFNKSWWSIQVSAAGLPAITGAADDRCFDAGGLLGHADHRAERHQRGRTPTRTASPSSPAA